MASTSLLTQLSHYALKIRAYMGKPTYYIACEVVLESEALRLIDANANRASEGLRTLEDIARLVRENSAASRALKQLRHQLAEALMPLPRLDLLASRSAATDAGTQQTTTSEQSREDLNELISAACQRVQQSLRVLEEASKLVAASDDSLHSVPQSLKQLRYKAYDVLAKTEIQLSSIAVWGPLYVLIDCQKNIDEFEKYLGGLAQANVGVLQIRDKNAPAQTLLDYGRAAQRAIAGTGCKLVINDRVDIALAVGADGVHLGQDDLPLAQARKLARGRLQIGISTHNLTQAVEAEQGGADHIGCGPTFPSQTKSFDAFAGIEFLQQVAEKIRIPYYAIGGIRSDNLSQVLATGCSRVAMSHEIHGNAQPIQHAQNIYQLLKAE